MKYLLILSLFILAVSCSNEKTEVKQETEYSVTIEPFVLEEGKTTDIPVRIQSTNKGFDVSVYLRATDDGIGYGYTVERDIVPELVIENMHYLGVEKHFYLDRRDTNIIMQMKPKEVIYTKDKEMPYSIYIKGNNSDVEGFHDLLGVECDSSYFTVNYE
jgi:hypothetical protein